MPIKNPTTRLVAQNSGSGKPASTKTKAASTRIATNVATGVAISQETDKETQNRENENKRTKKTTFGTATQSSTQDKESNLASRNKFTPRDRSFDTEIVFTFAPTDYDVFLTGSGINSYQPVIIADVPFSNYFGSESPSYDIVKVQQDLQDSTVKIANDLVKNFYSTNQAKKTALEKIRSKNLSFYNTGSNSVSTVASAARNLLATLTVKTAPDPAEYNTVTNNLNSTLRYAGSVTQTRPGTPYNDDDVIKASRFTSHFDDLLPYGIYKSTLLGQVLHDRVSVLKYGTSASVTQRSASSKPDVIIKPLYSVNESQGLGVYRHVLERTARAWQEGGFISDEFLKEFDEPDDDGFDFNDFYKIGGYSITNSYNGGFTEAIGGFDSETAKSKPSGVKGVIPNFKKIDESSPSITERSKNLILITANLINEQIGGETSNNLTLPQFLRNASYNSQEYTINSTGAENKLPLVASIGNKNYSLFDVKIANDQAASTTTKSLLAATTFDIDELSTLKDKILNARNQLDNVITANTGYLSNQVAVFLMKCMFDEYYNFFKGSVLTTGSSKYSLARTIMFFRAISSEYFKAVVWTMCNNKAKIRNAEEIDNFEKGIKNSIAGRDSLYTDYSNGGVFSFDAYADKVQQTEDDAESTADTSRRFLEKLFDTDSSFGMFDRIANKFISQFPQIDGTVAEGAIKITSYIVFLDILSLLKVKYQLRFTEEVGGENYNGIVGFVEFSKRDTTAITDCLRSALTTSDITDFSTYAAYRGGEPYESTKDAIRSNFWSPIRGIVQGVLSEYESFVDVASYTRTLLSSALTQVDLAVTAYNNLTRAYQTFDNTSSELAASKAKSLISKYSTPESIVELKNRQQRYLKLIKNTDMTSMAARSPYFRSVVEATHRDVLTERQAKIYVVGIPYGMLEVLRLESPLEQTFSPEFNVHINKVLKDGSFQRVDYYLPQDALTGSLVGYAYSSSTVSVTDDQESTTRFTNYNNKSIFVDSFNYSIGTIFRANGTQHTGPTYDSQKVQSALESYVEDLYGLYPRYAFTKSQPERLIAEDDIATEIANTYPVEEQESQLIRSRIKAAILMHKDFCTTTMVNDLETAPLFDKIIYCLVETETLGNLASLTAKVQV